MRSDSSRRSFLAAGLAVPIVRASATPSVPSSFALTPPAQAAGGLSYRTLGKTGLKATSLGFGCMITSDASVITRAADMGINFFDTARVYGRGNNERMVGAALGSKRKDVILSSKSQGKTGQAALEELDTSLKEIGTDYLDIWYLHAKDSGDQITDDLLEAQQTAKKAGKIRFAGVSTHGGHESVFPAAIKSGKIDVILTTYNFAMSGGPIDSLIQSAVDAGIGVVAMKVMAGSLPFPEEFQKARELMKNPGVALAALKWSLRNPAVVPIPSITDIEQLEENFTAMAASFDAEDEKLLSAQLDHIRPLYCRMCGACAGKCEKGLPVADMLRILTYADGYGQFGLARERFLELPAEARHVRCDQCTTCSIQCPNGVEVAKRLTRAQELLA